MKNDIDDKHDGSKDVMRKMMIISSKAKLTNNFIKLDNNYNDDDCYLKPRFLTSSSPIISRRRHRRISPLAVFTTTASVMVSMHFISYVLFMLLVLSSPNADVVITVTATSSGERIVSQIKHPPPPPPSLALPSQQSLKPLTSTISSVKNGRSITANNNSSNNIGNHNNIVIQPPPPPPPVNQNQIFEEKNDKNININSNRNSKQKSDLPLPPTPPPRQFEEKIVDEVDGNISTIMVNRSNKIEDDNHTLQESKEKTMSLMSSTIASDKISEIATAAEEKEQRQHQHQHQQEQQTNNDDSTFLLQSPSTSHYQQEQQHQYRHQNQRHQQQQHMQPGAYQGRPGNNSPRPDSYQSLSANTHLRKQQALPAANIDQQHQHSSSYVSSVVPSSSTLFIKRLWGKVERGLDELADIEDTMTGRAQKIANIATKTVLSSSSQLSKISPSTIRSLAQSRAAAVATTATAVVATATGRNNNVNNVRFGKRRSAGITTTPDPTSVPLKPFGQKYQIAREENERRNQVQLQQQQKKNILVSGKNNLILANGGATSIPYNHPQQSQSQLSSFDGNDDDNNGGDDVNVNGGGNARRPVYNDQQRKTADGNTNNKRRTDTLSSSNNDPSLSSPLSGSLNKNPYTGNGSSNNINRNRQVYDPSRSQPPMDLDQHSRSSRIPWDTSPTSPSSDSSKGQRPSMESARPSTIPGYMTMDVSLTTPKNNDQYDMSAWKRALRRFKLPLPSVPDVRNLFQFRNRNNKYHLETLEVWDSTDKDEEKGRNRGIFGFFKRSRSSSSLPLSFRSDPEDSKIEGQQPPLIASMLRRCQDGKTISLLRDTDVRSSIVIGRYQAVLDALFIVSIIMGFKLMTRFDLPESWDDLISVTLPNVGSILNELILGSWSFFAFLYAYLFKYTRERILDRRMDTVASSIASSVKEESEYAQLYLRLMAAVPMDRSLPNRLSSVSKKQVATVVSKARLNSYIGIMLASLMFMTFSAVGPVLMSLSSTFTKIILLQEWRQWPVPWRSLFSASSSLMQNLFQTLEIHSNEALWTFLNNPTQYSFHISMFASLLICSLLPGFEERRAVVAKNSIDNLEEDVATSNFESAEEWSRLGTSSASRLSMLSENGSVENALARWQASRVTSLDKSSLNGPALSSLLRLVAYTVVAALVAILPLVVSHFIVGVTPSLSIAFSILQWDSLFDMTFFQFFLFGLVYQTLRKVMESVEHISFVKSFQTDLVNTKKETDDLNKGQSDFQVMGSVSPSAGIAVRNLWAAHTTKRAWAIRGANLQCKNGEILAIVGDDGNGKTRLLTTLSEALIFPPKRTLTTNKVRGFIAICGLESSKWDRKMLKRRLGILLSDVRMVADSASLFSGWTMEEILEPVDGHRPNNNPLQRTLTSAEKSSMLLSLKITGLYGTLLARLPSKTSTIFTVNEEDLRPTSLKPRSAVLSPGEWSKLILARVLAQTIFDNDNVLASNDKIENSLIGSILLLDEPTMMHSEVEEGQLLRDLRLTGAATILTTNKWATGRLADQICVVKNGSIVEMGGHNELIARGPQQSLYAAKWHAMTIQ